MGDKKCIYLRQALEKVQPRIDCKFLKGGIFRDPFIANAVSKYAGTAEEFVVASINEAVVGCLALWPLEKSNFVPIQRFLPEFRSRTTAFRILPVFPDVSTDVERQRILLALVLQMKRNKNGTSMLYVYQTKPECGNEDDRHSPEDDLFRGVSKEMEFQWRNQLMYDKERVTADIPANRTQSYDSLLNYFWQDVKACFAPQQWL
jgi:hypothetical protein